MAKETYSLNVPILQGGETVAASLVEQGLIPSVPYHPQVAFATQAVELYCTSQLCCPHFVIQPFVKSLCNLHGIPFKPYLSKQFSIAFNVYLAIHDKIEKHIQVTLKHDMPNWRLHHACPACTYKLEGEKKLMYEMLVTMDGNDSLKHVIRRGPATEDKNGELVPGKSKELQDDRNVDGDYYISREKVDQWAKETLEEMPPTGKELVCW